jgi:hypothetical protein
VQIPLIKGIATTCNRHWSRRRKFQNRQPQNKLQINRRPFGPFIGLRLKCKNIADNLAAADWWDDHVLGYQSGNRLGPAGARNQPAEGCRCLNKMSVGATCLRVLPFHSAGCLGRKSLYPFAILFRELSAEQKGKLLERAQHWPEPLAKQVARAARAAERFRGRSNGFFAKMDRKWSTI